MRILIAPDKFKGSLTALQAAEAIQRGLAGAGLGREFRLLPIADGGEGTAEVILKAKGGEWIEVTAGDALGRPIAARYAWSGRCACMDMSAAAGIANLQPGERDPLRASTRGVGEIMGDAIRRGAERITVGLGGSATNDGGAGMAAALGYEFLTSDGEPLEPIPENLLALTCIKPPENAAWPPIIALCDVQIPLLGDRGATYLFGPQKGADAAALKTLEAGLEHLADMVSEFLGSDFRNAPGAGAAGGLGFGLLSFCGAEIQSGFDTVAGMIGLEAAIAESDFVITGEGRLDGQTPEGKGPAGVARLARKHGKPVAGFAGSIVADPRLAALFDLAWAITPDGMPLETALREAAPLLERAAAQAAPELEKLLSGKMRSSF